MKGLGTIINVALIIVGGTLGCMFSDRIQKKIQETLFIVTGVCILFIGIAGTLQHMLVIENSSLQVQNFMMIICCLSIGTIVGEKIDIDHQITNFAEYINQKTNNENNTKFTTAFVNTSCIVCIGAMAIIGAIQDGVHGDITILTAKGIVDCIIVCIMSAPLGKGCVFSAIPVSLFQGSITLLAIFIHRLIVPAALDDLSCVGSIMIFCVGLNMIFDKKIRVSNMLPAILVAIIWGTIFH